MWPSTRLPLALVLCSLLLHGIAGFPLARQALAKSAHGDDLISGSDFLSVFIGATVPRPRPANRSHVTKRPGSVPAEEPSARTEFGDELRSSELENAHHDLGNKVIDNLASFSSHLENDLDSIPNADAHTSFVPNAPEHGDTEPIGQSSITSSKRLEYLADETSDEGTTLPPTASNSSFPTLGIESAPSPFLISGEVEPSETIPFNTTEESEVTTSSQEAEENPHDNTDAAVLLDSGPAVEEGQNETHKVISVRVSSSVARLASPQQSNKIENDNKDVFSTFFDAFSETADKEEENVSLVTEEQPAATAVQRSELSVEEASPSSSIISVHHESSSSQQSAPQPSIESSQSAPVSYHTSVSTATSGSRVQFYREPPSYHRVSSSAAETVQRSVVANNPHQGQQQNYGQPATVFQRNGPLEVGSQQQQQQHFQQQPPSETAYHEEISRSQSPHHERNYEVSEQHYGTPERSYARPEQNYEVDESVSVMTNGRAHGVQYPPATTPGQVEDTGLRDFSTQPGETRDPNSKFGYVVEGRNFRKYRVEERTSDGFIVGEYGVVSHDDGSLRGVRYTADGTINPRLIYDALVKFLSL